MNKTKISVSVIMITYNHEKYIKQAVEGVLMQQCSFPVQLIIADDNSLDATETIVKQLKSEHLNGNGIKYTKHPINKGINPNFIWAAEQCIGKYIALCEGDDYWTDPLKLQKQVDFLEANEKFTICGTQVNKLTKDKILENKIDENFKGKNEMFFSRADVLKHNPFNTCSVVFRNMKIPKSLFKNYNASDWVLYLFLLKKGKGCILNIYTAVYNYHGNGIASSLTHATYLQKRLQDRLTLASDNKKDKKIIKRTGLVIIWNYIKQAIRFRKEFMQALYSNRKLIIEFVLN